MIFKKTRNRRLQAHIIFSEVFLKKKERQKKAYKKLYRFIIQLKGKPNKYKSVAFWGLNNSNYYPQNIAFHALWTTLLKPPTIFWTGGIFSRFLQKLTVNYIGWLFTWFALFDRARCGGLCCGNHNEWCTFYIKSLPNEYRHRQTAT